MTLTGGIQLCEDLMLLRMRSRPLERSPRLEQPPLRDLPGHRLRSPSPALPWPVSEALGAQGKLSPLNPVLTSVSPPVFATRDPSVREAVTCLEVILCPSPGLCLLGCLCVRP